MGYTTGIELRKYESKQRRLELNAQRFLNKKHHLVKATYNNRGILYFPSFLIGKRIKITLVDEEWMNEQSL